MSTLEFDTKYLKVFKNEHYLFSQRLGIDSVAFILLDNNRLDCYGLINEFKPPINKFLTTAFGGSLDSNLPLLEIVIQEVAEEAGYVVTEDDIKYYGKMFVSTQMNQFCHMYLVDITGIDMTGRTTEDPLELQATTKWLDDEQVYLGNDWKAITIMAKEIY